MILKLDKMMAALSVPEMWNLAVEIRPEKSLVKRLYDNRIDFRFFLLFR